MHPDVARASFIEQYKAENAGKAPSEREVKAYHKKAEERFSRFSVVGNIMRGEGRARYDHFLANGFPAWKGTGYYYSRYRPGTAAVLVGLVVFFGGLAHYAALQVSHRRHKDFVDRYIKHARKMAWGDSAGIPGIAGASTNGNGATGFESKPEPPAEDDQAHTWNRKQRRFQEKEAKKTGKNPKAAKVAREKGISTPIEAESTTGPVGAKKRVTAKNGKVLIVDSLGSVYVEEQTEEGATIELLLDVCILPQILSYIGILTNPQIDAIEKPTIYDTILFSAPTWVYRKSIGRFINPSEPTYEDEIEEPETLEESALDQATSVNVADSVRRGKSKPRQK